MRPHERLDVWNKAIDLVMSVYRATESFPKEERFGLTSQIRRAAVSIPANIAGGCSPRLSEGVHILSVKRAGFSQRTRDRTSDSAKVRLPRRQQLRRDEEGT